VITAMYKCCKCHKEFEGDLDVKKGCCVDVEVTEDGLLFLTVCKLCKDKSD
jgi:hypothetical protein